MIIAEDSIDDLLINLMVTIVTTMPSLTTLPVNLLRAAVLCVAETITSEASLWTLSHQVVCGVIIMTHVLLSSVFALFLEEKACIAHMATLEAVGIDGDDRLFGRLFCIVNDFEAVKVFSDDGGLFLNVGRLAWLVLGFH